MFATYAVAGVLVIVARSLMRKNIQRRIQDVWVALGILAAASYSLPMATFLTHRQTTSFDAIFYHLDYAIGLSGQALCWYANTHASLWALLAVVYQGVPLWLAIVYIVEDDVTFMLALAVGLAVAPIFYFLMPAIGPGHAFPGWPYQTPDVGITILQIANSNFPRNCLPSGHFMLAFMPLLFMKNRWLRALALAYLFLMVMATIGSGEHYAVDLLAAIPYSLFTRWLVLRWPALIVRFRELRKEITDARAPSLRHVH